MEIAILLHLYQPITQNEEVFRRIYNESYAPFLRRVGKLRDFKVSLDIPLSLLEQMDRFGYSDWLYDIKELVRIGKVELVGSAAYHPILPKLSDELIEQQVILNEYGLGYYIGDHQNLEGDPSIMIRDLWGFFPPELAVSEKVLSVLDNLGYKWMVIDETAVGNDREHKHGIYKFKDYDTKLVARNRAFSNLLSFKRDTDIGDIEQALKYYVDHKDIGSFAIVLDGEFFGHHYKDGLLLLDRFVSLLRRMDIDIISVSEYVQENSVSPLSEFKTSSWGATDEDMNEGNIFPMWDQPDNEIHKKQWKILNALISLYNREHSALDIAEAEEYSVLPFWDSEGLKRIKNTVLRGKMAREILTQKSMNSDQFWWASKEYLPTGEYLYDPNMVKQGLQIFEYLVGLYNNESLESAIKTQIMAIHDLLNEEKSEEE